MPLDKKSLIREFQKKPKRYWKVQLFDNLGFERRKCENCGKYFWTLDSERKICSDPSCQNYEFIGKPITKRKWDYIETWKEIEKFFVNHDHTKIQRYPVVCKWRPDLFFNNASIVDFQRLLNGKIMFEYPANPLIVLQPCLRFRDIENVGVSGRHHVCFNMPGQHAFNPPKEGYWKDRCIELNFEFWTKVAKVAPEELVYMEDLWAMPDFSVFGTSLELFSRGLELVTNVFMEFRKSNSGFEETPIKVIDVGWGHERVCWFSNGTPTSYDVVFGPVVKKLKKVCEIDYDKRFFLKYSKLSGSLNTDEVKDLRVARVWVANQLKVPVKELEEKVSPLEALYSIADHTKSLMFAIADGGLPSNVGGGYNLRVILRRALNFIDKFKWNLKLEDVVFWHMNYLKKIFPDLVKHKDEIATILEVEEKKYKQTKERTKRIVKKLAESKKKLTQEDIVMFYESDGINPDLLVEAGVDVVVPTDFYTRVTARHMEEKLIEEKFMFDVTGLPDTRLLFYENPNLFKFKTKVLKIFDDNFIVLDKTAFYPTSGGQLHDKGLIDGKKVLDVQKIGKVLVHKIAGKIKKRNVICEVDKKRREIISGHHLATHLINAASRQVLGNHVWQHGAEKDVDKARLDITHYDNLSEEQIEKIEDLANTFVEKDLPVKIEILPRAKAEEKYGFIIYQGGVVPEKNLRIVSVGNIDTEACGGVYPNSTGKVGFINILRTKRIQDGVVRIEFCSGDVALNYLKEKEKILKKVAGKLKVKEDEVPKAVEKLFKHWKKKRKQLKKVKR